MGDTAVKNLATKFAAFVLGAFALAGCQAVPHDPSTAMADPMPQHELISSSPMPHGLPTNDAPPGFISFCTRYADQCAVSRNAARAVHLDLDTQGVLDAVNRGVNASIWPEDDMPHYGIAEFWTIPTDGYGNCHDYAVTKRKELITAGLPERALRIAIVITPSSARHAVLTVTTDRGDLVLDNLSDQVKPWTDVAYNWIERQDNDGELGWVQFSNQVARNETRGRGRAR
jgi:predicted transglutaminase-like cysteine proteinase